MRWPSAWAARGRDAFIRILFCATAGIAVGQARADEGAGKEVRTIRLPARQPDWRVTAMVIHDPVYGGRKRFRGRWLAEYLDSSAVPNEEATPPTFVQFVCGDGYDPLVELSVLRRDGAFLATGDLDARPGEDWRPIPSSTPARNPGRYYLVWPWREEPDAEHPWPYDIVALRIGTLDALVGPAAPRTQTAAEGFRLFRVHCIKCHSVNGVGGTTSIDLNVPLNVFEYWQPDRLAEFVADPSSVRRNSRMPAFRDLDATSIRSILRYLEEMQGQKVLPP